MKLASRYYSFVSLLLLLLLLARHVGLAKVYLIKQQQALKCYMPPYYNARTVPNREPKVALRTTQNAT